GGQGGAAGQDGGSAGTGGAGGGGVGSGQVEGCLPATEPADLHVAVDGSNANDGTATAPFATIQHAVDAAAPGQTVRVSAGTYYERVVVSTSGTNEAPIVLEGECGADGEWLTIIDGSEPTAGWVPAPAVDPDGHGVYQTDAIGFEPLCMIAGGRDVPRLAHHGDEYDGFLYLPLPADEIVVTQYLGLEVNYWDGIEGLYFHESGTTYLRFRDGEDPSTMDVRAAPDAAALRVDDAGFVTVRNFLIRGAARGVEIAGSGAVGNVIEHNHLMHGQWRVQLRDGAADNEVRRNIMQMSGLSDYAPGAWGGGSTYEHAVKEHIYNTFKHEVGAGTWSPEDDGGVFIAEAGSGNRIHGNDVFDTLVAINVRATSDVEIFDNELHAISSVGMLPGTGGEHDLRIHDNLIYDGNILVRFHHWEEWDRSVYFYRNRLYNPPGVGSHMYFHFSQEQSTPSDYTVLWFYHNSLAGGSRAISVSGWSYDNGGLQKTRFVNNALSAPRLYGGGGQSFYEDSSMVDLFDFNWLGGAFSYGAVPAWSGSHNIEAEGERLWDDAAMPDFLVDQSSPAREAGIDLSQPFTIEAETYAALPGMTPGYFTGTAPDLGALQYGESP
ncbi:MAG: right-handed parallel beta-helix repeat-containing protein, partial [Deltaproteobacteria bacterium]|nr:right-handed parallel beta-helix repeat-containing protein [Deltaproteobacteria bacterium]MBW2530966.1 right-handed parallel beta-helix repeat-containing protein [Deltaproteobacteria bacterium]